MSVEGINEGVIRVGIRWERRLRGRRSDRKEGTPGERKPRGTKDRSLLKKGKVPEVEEWEPEGRTR